jgi:hypothetical protein
MNKTSHEGTKARRGRIYHGVTRRKREKKGRRVRLQVGALHLELVFGEMLKKLQNMPKKKLISGAK